MREKAWCRISIVGILCCILIPGLESTWAEENADRHLKNGQALLERQQTDQAIAALKTAVHMDSSLGEAYLLLGEAYGKKSDEALERGLDAYKRAIACGGNIAYTAHKALGDLYIARGLFDEAILEYQQIVEAPFKDGEIVKNLGIAYYKAGRLNESLSMLEKGKELDGTDPEIAFYLGCIYQQKSMFEKAVQYFHRTIELAPETALALSASSKMALIEAKGTVRMVKDIQDPEVHEIIQQAPDQDAYPNAGAIILLNHVEYEVHADHTMTQREHRIVKILNDRGKRYGEIKIGYDSTYETVEVVYARTIRKDGTIVHVGQKAMRDLAPWSGFPLYNNVKMKIISMPEVAEGAVLEYVAIKRSIKMLGGDKFQCRLALQGQEPHRLHRLVVTVPKGTPLQTKYLRIEGLNPDISVNDDRETYTWEIRDVPEVIGEPNMPPIREISPFIMVSSWESWDEFARWWRDVYEDRIQADEGIKEQVAELIKDKDSEAERAAAIYEYVGPHIRYVGLEYGEGGYQPHKATEVFFNKYGDCKDQAMLLLSMLHTAGIKAYPVLLGAGGYGQLQQDIPMSQFNHVIVAANIEGELVWMDGTSTTCSYGDIPSGNQQKTALVFFGDRARFVRIPLQPPEDNVLRSTVELSIQKDLSVEGMIRQVCSGQYNRSYRGYFKYKKPVIRQQALQSWINSMFPGGHLTSYTLSDLDDFGIPMQLTMNYTAQNYVKRAGSALFFKIPGQSATAASVGKQERTYPIYHSTTDMKEDVVEIRVPEGYVVDYVPEPVRLDFPFAYYEHAYTVEGHLIRFRSLYRLMETRISVEQYPQYKQFVEQRAQELDKQIVLREMGS